MFLKYSKIGKFRYCQIVESYKDSDKKPKHKIILSLGKVGVDNLPLNKDKLLEIASKINIACGLEKGVESNDSKEK